MNNTNINEKVKVKSGQVKTGESAQAKSEVSTGAMIATGTIAALFGAWALACFVGGLVASGGPLSFVKSWFTAVSGM